MTGVSGVIIADLAMITAVTNQTTTVDDGRNVTDGSGGMTGITMTNLLESTRTDVRGTKDEDVTTGTLVADRQTIEGEMIEVEKIGGGMMIVDGMMIGGGMKIEGGMIGHVREVGEGAGEETKTGIDNGLLRNRNGEQKLEDGTRRTDAGHNYVNKLRQNWQGKFCFVHYQLQNCFTFGFSCNLLRWLVTGCEM